MWSRFNIKGTIYTNRVAKNGPFNPVSVISHFALFAVKLTGYTHTYNVQAVMQNKWFSCGKYILKCLSLKTNTK